MDRNRDGKRKKDKHSEDDESRRENKSKRPRSRSRSRDRTYENDSRRRRRHSMSKSPINRKQERRRESEPEVKRAIPERKPKETDMLNTRTGGAYIPPARLRMMQAQITDKSSAAYQRLAWEALKKSIHGHINKINVGNIGIIIKELLKENIVRGRGLLCRSVIQAQAASPTFTNVYAALVAAVNSRFPNIGELLLKRLVIQFKRGFKRNDKAICISSASFIAHLVNQRVAHEILALELLTLLVESPTDDSVEVSIAFLKECGQKLTEVSSKGVNAIFEMLRNILHEGQLDKRVQYMIEVMFQVWKDGFKDHPALIEELELVPEEEQFTHLMMLDEATDPQDILNVFRADDKYEENEQKYKTLSKEILGSDAESGEEDGSGESGSEESDEEKDDESGEQKESMTIIDNTETNLVALRRTIYLTINSSLDFEECAHKLMKMQLKPGQEVELCNMFLDCCAEQRTYEKFYGLLAQRFCNINRIYIGPFEEIFKDSYSTAHRLDTNRLRNVSKFFAHLLFTDSISWEALECVKLNEEDTTSSSRIYIKILFQELAEYMGLKKLNDRLKDPTLQDAFGGIFPRDNPKNTRFSINFFTSIGLGGLTDELREHLKQMPKNVPAPIEIQLDSGSESSSGSSSSSSDSDSSSSESSSSDSEPDKSKKKKDKNSKKDNKNKTPEVEESEKSKDTERWGHDGFYGTYGKDARRIESRPPPLKGQERNKDDFVRPRDLPRRDERNGRDREPDQRNSDYRRDDNRRRRDERDEEYERDGRRRNRDERTDYSRREYNDRPRNRESDREPRQELGDRRRDKVERGDESRRDDGRHRNKDDEPRPNYDERRRYREDRQDDQRREIDERKRDKGGRQDDAKQEDENRRYKDQRNGRDDTSSKQDKENLVRKGQPPLVDVRKDGKQGRTDDSREGREPEKETKTSKKDEKRSKDKKKDKQIRKSDTDSTPDSDTSSDEEDKKKRTKKSTKKVKKSDTEKLDSKSNNKKRSDADYDTDTKKHKKSKKKDKNNTSDVNRSGTPEDGWDIRGRSVQKEMNSYWNTYSYDNRSQNVEEKTPERKQKSKKRD